MSFWGATVITSLATVIPVVGKTVVYWLWGGFYTIKEALFHGDVKISTLLDAGKGFWITYKHVIFQGLYIYLMSVFWPIFVKKLLLNKVKILYTLAQSAGLSMVSKTIVRFCQISFFGTKKEIWQKSTIEHCCAIVVTQQQRQMCSLVGSQRLNAEDLMWLVGFVEGDGSFSVNKNGKYVKYEFAIELSARDVQLLYKIKNMLGVGSITLRTIEGRKIARYKIASKPDLVRVIVPIFDKYSMLTSKQYDYLHFRKCLLNNVLYYANVPQYIRPSNTPFTEVKDILYQPYFDCWLVGLMEAECSFSTYPVTGEPFLTSSFEISQSYALQIMVAIKQRFGLVANPFLQDNNYKLKTTSTRGIQNVINFLKQTPAKLKGYKRAQYLAWLHSLRNNPKYRKLNVPDFY